MSAHSASQTNQRKEVVDVSRNAQGIWRDEVYQRQEDGSEILLSASKKRHNLITEPFTVLIPALLANDPGLSGGILYHAIGTGDETWDTSGIPQPNKFDRTLLNETSRLSPDGIVYLKWGEGKAHSGTATTIVDPSRIAEEGLVGRFEPDGFFIGMQVEIVSGTNVGETRQIIDYEQSLGRITVDTPFTAPIDSTSEYEFIPQVTTERTNVIEIRTSWDYGHPSDEFNFTYIREQGLFGGVATEDKDTGYMLDRITHERIWKDPTIRIVRFIDLVFKI